ncbi:pentapeptide MXKDX repeat protein [Gluconacetobacter diazotrophicus]|nr:pentapeptide MXKDX repeat protein [Gluconacetobacter diazotrophicus]
MQIFFNQGASFMSIRHLMVAAAIWSNIAVVGTAVAQDSMSRDAMAHDGMARNAMSHDKMAPNAMSQDAMRKHADTTRHGMEKNAMSGESMSHDGMMMAPSHKNGMSRPN